MSFHGLLDDKCNIYHLKDKSVNVGFGIPSNEEKYYSNVPDLKDIPCHFNKVAITVPNQQEDKNVYLYDRKLNLPIGTVIHAMDKVIEVSTGTVYVAGKPDNIRNHHIAVPLKLKDEYL